MVYWRRTNLVTRQKAPKATFKLVPYPLQQEIIDCDATVRVLAIGRQSGKSWLCRYMALDEALNKGKSVMWVSPTKASSTDHWQSMLDILQGYPAYEAKESERRIKFGSGGSIRITPANGAFRGSTMHLVILDEAAHYGGKGEYIFYAKAMPMITSVGGKIVLASTPNGRNWFYDLYVKGQQNDPFIKSWRASSYESPYQNKELLDKIRAITPEVTFREEYLAEFLDSRHGVFTGASKMAVNDLLLEPLPHHTYVMGVDWGSTSDYTVVTIIDKYTADVVYMERFTAISAQAQISKIKHLMLKWRPDTTVLERNGIGEAYYKLLVEDIELSGLHIVSYYADNNTKRTLIENLSLAVEQGHIKLLSPNCEVGAIALGEMSIYSRRVTGAGNVVYTAPRGCHDDTVMSIAMAYKYVLNKQSVDLLLGNKELINPFRKRR